ncbi:hypothetical protein M2189_007514 [Bradyrhizobium japonicum]|uniref:hypothetical protein n=1 Tax=Bradyrhizobium japonicum TaxID=375 RepID=UPI0005767818|nr:hypothetical protein [Bradyrhizobium japonicum]MBR0734566.1 hypothetical protein [Bradyrhizobium japonicum]MBR0802432.1 hypothetical protein [Bradyrhizobium japonicum]MCS3502973.1 hypothetical protein [Bradyrhizobium japonicum]MCS3964311.1 hypothetical protein [Bradyrhizobium japonicum]MCS3996621.1 hypothetical protein [Bradyrhizobium japonicum]
MYKLIRTIIPILLLSGRAAAAHVIAPGRLLISSASVQISSSQPSGPGLVGRPPVGHRQPKIRDVLFENPNDLERRSEEDIKIDRKLIICRGC